jgi:hypothetical protein
MEQGPGAFVPKASVIGLGPQRENKCWPRELGEWFTAKWALDYVSILDKVGSIPVVAELFGISGGYYVWYPLAELFRFGQSGCDVGRYGIAKAAQLADGLEMQASIVGNDFVAVAADIASPLLGGPPGLGRIMKVTAPALRCASSALRQMASGDAEGSCVLAKCFREFATAAASAGMDVTIPAELATAEQACLAAVSLTRKDCGTDPTTGLPLVCVDGTATAAATGQDISKTRDIGGSSAGAGAGLLPAALLGYLFFLR